MFFNKKKSNESNSYNLVKIAALLIHAARIDEKYSIYGSPFNHKTIDFLDLKCNFKYQNIILGFKF